jgi:hypothetical protein
MSKTRLILASVLAVFAVSAVASASAMAAPQYFIEEVKFEGPETVNAQPKSGTVALLTSKLTGGATIEIQCTGGKLKGAVIEKNNLGKGEAIVYEKCKVKTPATCHVAETLTTNAVSAEALDVGETGVSEKFKPTSGETFISISITGCSGEGKYNVTGSAECTGVNPTIEEVNKTCDFTSGSGTSLKFGTNAATLTQESEFFLTGPNVGKKWVIKH